MDGGPADDEGYPSGPQPPHERSWRHPSEIGEARWRHSEPPIALGRGLLFTTGALGGLLALAVLWATLPTGAGGGSTAAVTTVSAESLSEGSTNRTNVVAPSLVPAAVTTGSVAVGGVATTLSRPTTTVGQGVATTEGAEPGSEPEAAPADDGSLESIASASPTETTSSDAATVSSSGPATGSSSPGTTASAPTSTAVASANGAPTSSASSTSARSSTSTPATIALGRGSGSAIAVSVGDTPLVITTAGAVGAEDTVMLSYGAGRTSSAAVVMVDRARGLAVLAPESVGSTSNFAVASAPKPGETITVLLGNHPNVSVAVAADGSLDVTKVAADTPEGTPVVNGSGALVGLCSRSSKGFRLLRVEDLSSLRAAVDALGGTTTTTQSPTRPAWMGVQFNADPAGSLTVNYVDPTGPAGSAGVVAGDTVLALNGTALASSSELSAALARMSPGDQVQITVRRGAASAGAETTLTVTLAERTATL